MINLLSSVIVKKFYERNAGFFLFVFFMMFGIVEPGQIISFHVSLIYGAIGSPLFLSVVCFLWLLYMGKCVLFIEQSLALPENSFLKNLNLLDKSKQSLLVLFALTMIYLPVLEYSLIVIGVAFYSGHAIVASVIIFFHILMLGAATIIIRAGLNSTRPAVKIFPTFRWPWPKPVAWFYVNHLSKNLGLVLFITKAFSIGMIMLFMQIKLDEYDYRVALMGFLFGLAAHMVIIFELRKFEDQSASFIRGLPLHALKRFSLIATAYAILLLPEIIVMGVNHIHFIDIVFIYVAGCSFLLFCHCSLYEAPLNMDKHMRRIMLLFLLGFGVTLFKLAIPVSILLLIASYLKYSRDYYQYEPG